MLLYSIAVRPNVSRHTTIKVDSIKGQFIVVTKFKLTVYNITKFYFFVAVREPLKNPYLHLNKVAKCRRQRRVLTISFDNNKKVLFFD